MVSSFLDQMEYLKSLAHFTPSKVVSGEYELGLGAISELLSLVGNPQNSLRIIHVAGTNGKGSTIAFLSEILKSAGYRVGVYTSPALLNVTEQIQINGNDISENDFAEEICSLKPYIDEMMAQGHKITTEFETITVAALSYFLHHNCDFVILECGLGGRTDATNVINTPLLSVITSIGLDHTEILGDTLEKIASEKAGIIKENGTAVVLKGSQSIMEVFEKKCREVNARLFVCSPDDKAIFNLNLGLKGKYQIINAHLAKSCAMSLTEMGYKISASDIQNGLCNASWPCRFEIINSNPTFIIDGSHNVDGVSSLVESLSSLYPGRRFRFLTGMLRDKSYAQMLEMVIPIALEFYTVTVPSTRALSASELSDQLSLLGAKSTSFDSIESAIDAAINDSSHDEIVCAFGSLYYVGKVRAYITGSSSL